VLIAAHYFGRTLACLTATMAVLAVSIFALAGPQHYMLSANSGLFLLLSVCIWAGFLGLTAIMVGTLSDQRVAHIRELRHAHMGIIEILSKYLQAADQYTKSHSQRVASLSEAIASAMGLKQAEIENIKVGALLHDIGKVEISTRLIQKAASLTEAEHQEMASHTVRGAELVRSLGSILEGAIPIIMHHHDYFAADAKAHGLHGDEIPVGARVIAVADAYDAIVTDRPYRRGRTSDEAIAIIRQGAGQQFDPHVVRAFERVMANRGEELEAGETLRRNGEALPVETYN
jgi:putative nucleotidyltransferase with HDIG domain